MPERIKLFCEGPHDHAFLVTLKELGALPADLELEPRAFKPNGKDAVPRKVRANNVARMATIVVRDFDELRGVEVASWLAAELGEPTAPAPLEGATHAYRLGGSYERVVVIGVGHLGTAPSEVATVERGTIDEYLFRLLLDRDVYEAASEIRDCPYDVWRAKLIETREMIVRNGLPAPTLKQLVRLPHLLTSFEGAPTTLTEKVLRAAHARGTLDALTDPLRNDVLRAVELLREA